MREPEASDLRGQFEQIDDRIENLFQAHTHTEFITAVAGINWLLMLVGVCTNTMIYAVDAGAPRTAPLPRFCRGGTHAVMRAVFTGEPPFRAAVCAGVGVGSADAHTCVQLGGPAGFPRQRKRTAARACVGMRVCACARLHMHRRH